MLYREPVPPSRRAWNYFAREVLTWPNLVTAVRLVCAIVLFMVAGEHRLVFILALVGAASDMLDGWLAKTFKLGTTFGKYFDQYTDWLFGAALLYAIYMADGMHFFEWPFNWELLGMIGAYLLLRTAFPCVQTSSIAKIKTFMQFCGGVLVLGGYARLSGGADGIGALCINGGYALVWASIGLMGKSLWDYWRSQ